MSLGQPSRATLQDVLQAIDKASNLTGKRKQDLRSAIRLVARVLGAEPALIVADPRAIGRRLESLSPLSLGLSAGRWANTRSLLRAALGLVTPVMAGASRQPFLKAWVPLAVEAGKVGSCRLRLTRLLRWLSARQITPDTVTRTDLDHYHQELLSDALLGNAEGSWQATRQSWERMRLACASWPQIILDKAPNPLNYSLPWDAYPASLKEDVDQFLAHLGGTDLAAGGPTRPLRLATLKLRDHELRSFAVALVHSGIDPQSLTTLGACLTLDNFKQGLQWHYKRGAGRSNATVHRLAVSLRQLARHWLKADDTTLFAMSKIISRLAPPQQAMSEKNRDRLRPFEDAEVLQALLNLPTTIQRHLETAASAKVRKTGLSTSALAIELLLNAPMRLSNLCRLHLDRNFISVGNKRHLFIPKEDVKNNVDLEFELPVETVAVIDWYVSRHRKAKPENRYLFPGEGVGYKTPNTLRCQIMEAVKKFTGHTVNPHLFRAIAGSIYLDAHPGNYETLRQVLGHRSINTTARFYAGHMDRKARQHYVDTVRTLRTTPPPASTAMRRKT